MLKNPERRLQLALGGALFMQGLDSTAIVPALPQIARVFDAPGLAAHVLLGAYFIGCGASLPIIGWASDRFGAKRVLLSAIALFILAGLASAAAPDLRFLTASRFLQGAAAATLMPVARLLAVRTAPPQSLLRIITSLTAPAMAGQTLGPLLGGLFTEHEAWRGIFLAGIPFAAASLAIVALIAPDARNEDCGRLDLKGVLLGVLAMACAVVGIGTMRQDGPPVWVALTAAASAIALGAAFVARCLNSQTPVIDFRVLTNLTFRRTFIGSVIFRLMVGATPFLLAIQFQSSLGLAPLQSGFLIMASGAGALLVKPFSAQLIGSAGYRRVLIYAGAIALLAFIVPVLFSAEWPLAAIALVLLFGGFFRSLEVTAFATLGYADLSPRDASSASVLSSMGQQLSHALGVSIAAGAIAAGRLAGADTAVAVALGILCIALLSALALPVFASLPRRAGQTLL